MRPQREASVRCAFGDRGTVYAAIDAAGGARLAEAYAPDGATLILAVRVPVSDAEALDAALKDATAGRVRLEDAPAEA